MKAVSTFCFFLFTSVIFGQQDTAQISLLFASNQSQFISDHQRQLQALFDTLKPSTVHQLTLSGHTDSDGKHSYNQQLASDRVEAVQTYLLNDGIDPSQIQVAVYGEDRPIASNDTEIGKQRNRRVDLVIFYSRNVIDQERTSLEEKEVEDTLMIAQTLIPAAPSWYPKLETPPQTFCIFPDRDTTIRCAQGTLIHVPAHTFAIRRRGNRKNCIQLRVKEVFSKSDMILENLSTTSDGRMIETDGMVYVDAHYNGERLQFNMGKEVMIMMPSDSIDPRANVFQGERQGHDSLMNWTVNTHSVLSDFSIAELEYCSMILCGGVRREEKCALFFCQFGKLFKKLFRKKRKAPSAIAVNPDTSNCRHLSDLFEEYQVDNLTDLIYTINQPLFEKFEVDNLIDLRLAIAEETERQIELNYRDRKVAFEDFRYYVYNVSRLGWSNIDIFEDIDPKLLVNLKIDLQPDTTTDVKLVFKERDFVIPPDRKRNYFSFNGVPKGEEVWIVAIKYDEGVPYLSMQETTIERKTYPVVFQQLSLEELKVALKELDRS